MCGMILPCMVRMPTDFDIPTWQRTKEELLPIPIRRGFDNRGIHFAGQNRYTSFALSQLAGASRLGNLLLRIQPSERPVIFRGLLVFFFLFQYFFFITPPSLVSAMTLGLPNNTKRIIIFCLLFSSDLNPSIHFYCDTHTTSLYHILQKL